MEEQLPFTPIIIIGAGRSGTNALRDALTQLPGMRTWPCDEIDAIWTYGNEGRLDDHFDSSLARSKVTSFIRRAFIKQWMRAGRPNFVVEKTCANSLRVGFIRAVLPEARFVFIVRNGEDVIASARKRWRGEMEIARLPYLLAKVRFVPLASLPRRAVNWVMRRTAFGKGNDQRLGWWGPRIRGHRSTGHLSIDEICAKQWVECVDTSEEELHKLPSELYVRITYEDLISNPGLEISRVMHFLGVDMPSQLIEQASKTIRHPVERKRKPAVFIDPKAKEIIARSQRRLGYSDEN